MYLNVAESAQRFFHPGDVDEMLEAILPKFEPSMDQILATQTFLVHFLPISHCQKWLPLSKHRFARHDAHDSVPTVVRTQQRALG